MSDTLAAALTSVVLITVSAFAFYVLIDTWDKHSTGVSEALPISRDRIDTHLAISTAEAADLGCDTFSA